MDFTRYLMIYKNLIHIKKKGRTYGNNLRSNVKNKQLRRSKNMMMKEVVVSETNDNLISIIFLIRV